MFSIADGRTNLYQWDSNIHLLVSAPGKIIEAHFATRFSKKALTVEVKKVNGKIYAEIPNILLQKAETIIVYAYYTDGNSSYTKIQESFEVTPRPKPDDYVYTETEVKTFNSLDERIKKLEETGGATEEGIANAINKYFEENPIDIDYAVKKALSDCKLTGDDVWTEEEKAKALELLGGMSKPKKPQYVSVICMDTGGNVLLTRYSATNTPYAITQRTERGTVVTDTPIVDNDATTKKYVDDLVGSVETILTELHSYAQTLKSGGES